MSDIIKYLTDEYGNYIASVKVASDEAAKLVMDSTPGDSDGRSSWMWVRLANGDLVLGVFPRGDTYFNVEGELP